MTSRFAEWTEDLLRDPQSGTAGGEEHLDLGPSTSPGSWAGTAAKPRASGAEPARTGPAPLASSGVLFTSSHDTYGSDCPRPGGCSPRRKGAKPVGSDDAGRSGGPLAGQKCEEAGVEPSRGVDLERLNGIP